MTYETEQENFWAGQFGDEYIERNRSEQLLASNLNLFGTVLSHTTSPIDRVLELGANVGMNLRALRPLLPTASLDAVEINAKAVEELGRLAYGRVIHGSLLDPGLEQQYPFVFTKTVLIHIAPEALPKAYDVIYEATSRYVLLAEYYNPSPVEITYRGHEARLFKRDFAGEFCARHPDVGLVSYGFCYRGDRRFPQDDITWFLMEKR